VTRKIIPQMPTEAKDMAFQSWVWSRINRYFSA
jgi:hypothetical protein